MPHDLKHASMLSTIVPMGTASALCTGGHMSPHAAPLTASACAAVDLYTQLSLLHRHGLVRAEEDHEGHAGLHGMLPCSWPTRPLQVDTYSRLLPQKAFWTLYCKGDPAAPLDGPSHVVHLPNVGREVGQT